MGERALHVSDGPLRNMSRGDVANLCLHKAGAFCAKVASAAAAPTHHATLYTREPRNGAGGGGANQPGFEPDRRI